MWVRLTLCMFVSAVGIDCSITKNTFAVDKISLHLNIFEFDSQYVSYDLASQIIETHCKIKFE